MSLAAITKSQITGPVRLLEGLDTRKDDDGGAVKASKYMATMLETAKKQQASYAEVESAVVALGEAEIQRWRDLVLANEPRRDWMKHHGSLTPVWLGVLYERAVLGVVPIGGENGETVLIPVADYWAMEKAKGTAKP